MITFIRIIPLKEGKINLTLVIMKVNDEMAIEISNDFYDKDYDDVSEKQIQDKAPSKETKETKEKKEKK